MPRKSIAFLMAVLLCVLTACGSVEHITQGDMIKACEKEDPLDSLEDTLTVQGPYGLCEYTVDSCEVYDSWADAGITAEQLSDTGTYGHDAGVALITITQRCLSEVNSVGWKKMNLNCFALVARSEMETARARGDQLEQWFYYLLVDAAYPLQDPYWTDHSGGSFWIPTVHAGESVTYTLGFVLDETARAAAEDGSLLLLYTTNGMPMHFDDFIMQMLPVSVLPTVNQN